MYRMISYCGGRGKKWAMMSCHNVSQCSKSFVIPCYPLLSLAIPCYPLLSCVIPCHPMPGPRLAASLGDVGQRMMVRPLLLVHSLFSASIYFPMRLTCICIHLYACCSIPIVLSHKYVYIAIYYMDNIVFYRVYVCIRYMYV